MSEHKKQLIGTIILVGAVATAVCIAVTFKGGSGADIKGLEKKLDTAETKISSLERQNETQSDALAKLKPQLNAMALDIQAIKLKAKNSASVATTGIDLQQPEMLNQLKEAIALIGEEKSAQRKEKQQARMKEYEERAAEQIKRVMDERLTEYAGELDLTQDQKEEMAGIWDEGMTEARELMSSAMRNPAGGREAWRGMREKLQGIYKNNDAIIKEILSEEQFENYTQLQEKNDIGRMMLGTGRRRGGNDQNRRDRDDAQGRDNDPRKNKEAAEQPAPLQPVNP